MSTKTDKKTYRQCTQAKTKDKNTKYTKDDEMFFDIALVHQLSTFCI